MIEKSENTVNQRIEKLIQALDLNENSFAKSLGVANPMIYNLVGGRESKPSFALLQKILSTVSKVNPDWLILGEGEMWRSKNDIISNEMGNVFFVEEEYVYAGLFSGFATEGLTRDRLARVSIPTFENGDLFMFPVRGESMRPFISNGDYLIVEEIRDLFQITSGHPYVFAHPNEGIVVKRLFQLSDKLTFEAKSDNPDYPSFPVKFEENAKIYIVKGVLTTNTSKR